MVRIHPDPPTNAGAVAQLGEHLLCKQGVVGSIPSSSTNVRSRSRRPCDTRRRHQNPEANGARAFCLWFREMRYRLFFNNAEEVKRILLAQRDGRPWAFRRVARAGWVRLLSNPQLLEFRSRG